MSDDRPTILLVEDDDVDALLIERLLARHELAANLLRAHDGQEALGVLRSTTDDPRVIVLDLNMPVMSGFEFLECLRADPALAEREVIILSTSSQERDVERAAELGVVDYFVKDVGPGHMEGFLARLRARLAGAE